MNSFVLKIAGETKMAQEELEDAAYAFLTQHDLISSSKGDMYVIHCSDVTVSEYEDSDDD